VNLSTSAGSTNTVMPAIPLPRTSSTATPKGRPCRYAGRLLAHLRVVAGQMLLDAVHIGGRDLRAPAGAVDVAPACG
jgi:hypothetical protein